MGSVYNQFTLANLLRSRDFLYSWNFQRNSLSTVLTSDRKHKIFFGQTELDTGHIKVKISLHFNYQDGATFIISYTFSQHLEYVASVVVCQWHSDQALFNFANLTHSQPHKKNGQRCNQDIICSRTKRVKHQGPSGQEGCSHLDGNLRFRHFSWFREKTLTKACSLVSMVQERFRTPSTNTVIVSCVFLPSLCWNSLRPRFCTNWSSERCGVSSFCRKRRNA